MAAVGARAATATSSALVSFAQETWNFNETLTKRTNTLWMKGYKSGFLLHSVCQHFTPWLLLPCFFCVLCTLPMNHDFFSKSPFPTLTVSSSTLEMSWWCLGSANTAEQDCSRTSDTPVKAQVTCSTSCHQDCAAVEQEVSEPSYHRGIGPTVPAIPL